MVFKIIQTFASKVLIALFSFLLLILTARYGGSAVRGEISLFLTNQTIIMLLASIIGGPSIVYLTTKVNTGYLFTLSYIWALTMALIVSLILLWMGLVSYHDYYFLLVIAILSCLLSINTHFLLGFQKISLFNFINISQVAIVFLLVFYYFVLQAKTGLHEYLISLTASYSILFLLSFFYVNVLKKENAIQENKNWWYYLKTGFSAQFSNLIQFLNYRLSYYFIALFLSEEKLGLFSTCVILSESIWLISSSLSTVGYTKISAEKNNTVAKEISFQLLRLNILITFFPVFVLALIPNKLYTDVLGNDFQNIRSIVLIMLIGIFAISIQRIISAYFSGIGKFHINNTASLIGLVFNSTFLYLFLKNYQLKGVALASTLAYLLIFGYSFYKFRKITGIQWKDMKPRKSDFEIEV
ncbi:MAG TPA: polysaccharide biosynthesis C-terminal domain-containing protein [Cytophagaceae bacterium]|jgi:O-antigen/teichoic acid export membrane protein|nr:polysaccharide biosynthesis C-terminal domain-containing protein [Cytophagaceae bacterium]